MKVFFTWIFCLCLLSAKAQNLRIAVAANAEFVVKQLAADFKSSTRIASQIIVSSSGKLTTQIEQGAPFDVFLSADMKYPLEIEKKRLALQKPRIYAYGQLVLWTLGNYALSTPSDLKSSAYNKIAVANPQLAPYGEAAMQALTRLNLKNELTSRIVYGESIAQVNQYLLTGAVQAAFTAKSIVLSPEQKGKGKWIAVDQKLYSPIAQGAVLLKSARQNNLVNAKKFYAYLFSTRAKKILRAYGYK